MNTLAALALLEHVQDCHPADLPCPTEARRDTQTPLSLTALASLSGALDDAAEWPALCEAIEHGFALVSADIVSFDQWHDEIVSIARDVVRHVEGAANGP